MVSRLAALLIAASLVALAPAPAHASDRVLAHDTLIQHIWALDGDVVYWRWGKPMPQRAWMVRYHRHLHRARGIPAEAFWGDLGLDAKGRKVFTFGTATNWFV